MSAAARRAVGIVCVGVVLATACVFLGRWQWNRHVWRDAAIAVVETNYVADPVPLDDVLTSTEEVLGTADGWLKSDGEAIYQATDLRVGLSKEKTA